MSEGGRNARTQQNLCFGGFVRWLPPPNFGGGALRSESHKKSSEKRVRGASALGGTTTPPKGETCDNFGVVGLTAGKNGAIIVQEVGNVEKNDTKVRLSVTLAPKVLEKLDILCREKGVSRPAIVALALDKYWKEEHPDW